MLAQFIKLSYEISSGQVIQPGLRNLLFPITMNQPQRFSYEKRTSLHQNLKLTNQISTGLIRLSLAHTGKERETRKRNKRRKLLTRNSITILLKNNRKLSALENLLASAYQIMYESTTKP